MSGCQGQDSGLVQRQGASVDPSQWDEASWRSAVGAVRAGVGLRPARWPGGCAVAVALSFDADAETPWLRDGLTEPGGLGAGQYGPRVATARILRLLERHDIPSTFFYPAVAALLHPDELAAVRAAGHEIAAHGWIHERPELMTEVAERDLLLRSLDSLERLAGARPRGWRAPSFGISSSTLRLLLDAGLAYDSSLMADDDPYLLELEGQPVDLVEVPVDWGRDDAAYFVMDRYNAVRPHARPRDVLEAWKDEYDGARREGGVFQLTLHPDLIGRRSRLVVLEALLDHIGAEPDVWFATHEHLVEHCLIAHADD